MGRTTQESIHAVIIIDTVSKSRTATWKIGGDGREPDRIRVKELNVSNNVQVGMSR
ncbi:hypothetical protein OCU04_006811 [Sclerotinia nivalis]|uniref:Uncharacterized protein n=1 Tax=Sclerotinia nivalis TaxID=352851 RepID=A0A9X0AKI8_9HELO|nr:hypothetical protein OCU04_006811 [Sclerotinia nivalis]